MADLGRGTVYRDRNPNLFRPDGTRKGTGWLGTLNLPGGGVTSEYSMGFSFDDRNVLLPTLVPTLTKEEIDLMVNDVIPNRKPVPQSVINKAIEHAQERMKKGESPFKD